MVKMRRGLLRLVGAATLTAFIFFYINYFSPSQKTIGEKETKDSLRRSRFIKKSANQVGLTAIDLQVAGKGQSVPNQECKSIEAPKTDIVTVEQFQKFEFQPSWMRGKEFWDSNFEKRYLQRRTKWKKFPLKVFLLPHSHNDPGWLKTYEEYYFHQSSKILSNMIEKLVLHPNMTFIWTEISYLSMWYDRAHPKLRNQLKDLVKSGRLEIATGGWIMSDEANVHIYSMVSQLIEGHQWLSDVLGIKPQNGWAIDVFGHGATMPYLLKESGISSTVIQRVHFAWKQWLAEKQNGDFMWRQNWDSSGNMDVLTHNCPYDIYSIKHSCGPHPQICLNFDFRKVFGEYTEYSIKAVNIDERNVKEKAELLLEQYGRTGSIFPHNVVLVPIGDDFRYDHAMEWDQQYRNYQRLIDWVNQNPSYHVDMQWGTLKDYFKEVRQRSKSFPTLKGDFFVYSDIFTEGRPAYWSGYYTTRPYWKVLARQLEAALSTAEILYTWAWASPSNKNFERVTRVLEKDYERLVKTRRTLGLFQHHDAITGTSKSYVMHDYAIKLHEGIRESYFVIMHASLSLLATDSTLVKLRKESLSFDYLQPNFERATYERLPKMLPISLKKSQQLIVLTNSLAQRRYEMIKFIITSINIRLTNELGHDIQFQVNPIWNKTGDGMSIVPSQYELFFIADLPPLSLVTYTIHETSQEIPKKYLATVYSNFYDSSSISKGTQFETKDVLPGDIQLESDEMKLLFDGTTGMLRSVTEKSTGKITQLSMNYAAYPSAQFKSGAYLFKPDPNAREPEEDVLSGAKARIFIQSGPVASELTVMFGSVLMHSFRVFHVNYEPLASAIYMENSFNLGGPYNNSETPGFSPQFRETELFFRFMTDINNGPDARFYTDQNGLHMQERIKVERIGIQGNYFPITSSTYLEDEIEEVNRRRLTLLVDHAAGAASWKSGWLEVMVERRTFYDDSRGMGEGVTDQKRTLGRYWLLIEHLQSSEEVPQLSLAANCLSNSLNYPPILLVLDELPSDSLKAAAHLVNRPFPCSLHLLTLRTLAEPQYPGLLPLNKALMVIQHQSSSCAVKSAVSTCRGLGDKLLPETNFTVAVSYIEETELTGVTKLGQLQSLSDLIIPHHRLRSVSITFK